MRVLHAAFHDESLLLWLEPAAGKKALASDLAHLSPGHKYSARQTIEALAWLPSRNGKPVPSTALLASADSPPAAGPASITPLAVNVIALDAARAIDLLAAAANQRMPAPALLGGDSLRYFTAALRFAAGLVMGGRYLPNLVARDSGHAAQWTPVISGDDIARFSALARAMPPAARALTFTDATAPPDLPAESVVLAFVTLLLDELVRTSEGFRHAGGPTIHDVWLQALKAPDGLMPARSGETSALAGQLTEWSRPVQVAARAPVRLTFRLDEPASDDDPWQVRYLLQGIKDPSLLVNAADAFKPTRGVLTALQLDAAAVREHLLTSLGQAAGMSPAIAKSLAGTAPAGYETDASGAHAFLRETAAALEQAGFGVMLPSWWTRAGNRAGIKARAKVRSKSMTASAGTALTLDSLVEFDWELALGGERITRAELTALAKLKSPLVKVRGQWVEVDAGAIQQALDFIGKQPREATAGDVFRMAIGAVSPSDAMEIDGIEANGLLGEMLDRLQGRVAWEELAPPAGLKATLRPYQVRGYSWLAFLKGVGLGACLADDMGLGKTIQTLAAIERDRQGGETRPVLLVCPTSLVGNWEREAARFTPAIDVLVHHGVTRTRGEAFRKKAAKHTLVVSSYSLLHRDQAILQEMDWAGVILDEAQNIKNAGTRQAQAARAMRGGYRMALTGTPVENNVGDLWSLMEFLNPGFLGSQSAFRRRFFVPIQVYGNTYASDRLRRITGPFILRRVKSDKSIISDLPDKLEMKVFCNLTREQASLYEAVTREAQAAIEEKEGIERKGLVLATLMKLKQICNHPAQFLHSEKTAATLEGRSGKFARLMEMMEEVIAADDRALIFTQFTEMGGMLQRALQDTFGEEVLYLHGGTSKTQRDKMVERFGSDTGPRLFLLSLKAGGTGLNLTRANHVFHFDRWWNPAVEDQATDRAFRIGQKRNVQVHKFVCAGTLEEKIDEMIERKKGVAGSVVGSGEAWLSELSNNQLRDLFALRKDAVGE